MAMTIKQLKFKPAPTDAGTAGDRRRQDRFERVRQQTEHCTAIPYITGRPLVRAGDWQPDRWRSCGSGPCSLVGMCGAEWYFCDGCLPESQWPALEARKVGSVGAPEVV
jgi:hypothetical protein